MDAVQPNNGRCSIVAFALFIGVKTNDLPLDHQFSFSFILKLPIIELVKFPLHL